MNCKQLRFAITVSDQKITSFVVSIKDLSVITTSDQKLFVTRYVAAVRNYYFSTSRIQRRFNVHTSSSKRCGPYSVKSPSKKSSSMIV